MIHALAEAVRSIKSVMENKVEETRSAGGVVLNSFGEVAVCNQRGISWSLPKGHIDPGEDAYTAAVREISEETGIDELEYIRELGTYKRYRMNKDKSDDISKPKIITMFLFRTSQSLLKPSDPDNPEAKWVKIEDVSRVLTHEKDKEFFNSIKTSLNNPNE